MWLIKRYVDTFTSKEKKQWIISLLAPLLFLLASLMAITELIGWLQIPEPSYASRNDIHKRNRRFIYMTTERRLNLPDKTKMALDFVLSLPGFNPLPVGFGSESALSIPVDVDLDKLGLTSSENNWGDISFLQGLQDQVGQAVSFTQSIIQQIVGPGNVAGGERSLMYQVVEDTLYNFGIDGKSCLLRAICEVHLHTLLGHGLLGEAIELFLSASKSTIAESMLKIYTDAEKGGKSGDCYTYQEMCPLSIIAPFSEMEKEMENHLRDKHSQKISEYENIVENEIGNSKTTKNKSTFKVKKYHPTGKNSTHWQGEHLSRQKRFLSFGPAGRLVLPLGSLFNTKAELKLPYLRGDLPDGYSSGLNMAGAFRVIFDSLGLTSLLNPFLRMTFLGNFGRRKRDTWQPLPGVNYEGGDRETFFLYLENILDKLNYDGRKCMLRAICEMHEKPFSHHGFLGELLHLFLSPSNALFAKDRLPDYLQAEKIAKTEKNCSYYAVKCPFSIFSIKLNRRNEMLSTM